jgi:hypothetical protein
MRREPRVLVLAAAIAVVVSAGTALASDWEVEIHGGGLLTLPPSSGRATDPPHGEPFQTIVPGVSTLRVTSWFFGDGGSLLERAQLNVATYTGSWQYITMVKPLDPVLESAAIGWPFRGGGGLRIGRRLGPRLSAELGIEYADHTPTFSDVARSGIENARSSFESSWSRMLSALPGSRASAQATLLDGKGRQLVATGAINITLRSSDPPKWSRRPSRRRFVSYLTLGGGVISTSGEEASATLVGRYQLTSRAGGAGAPFEETDTVTVRTRSFGSSVLGVVGLGWKQDLSSRCGLRFDARAYLGPNPMRIAVDARPSVTVGSPAAALVVDTGHVPVQFVNDSTGAHEGQRSSLSGPALAGFETFRGTGILWQINLTLGAFLRF